MVALWGCFVCLFDTPYADESLPTEGMRGTSAPKNRFTQHAPVRGRQRTQQILADGPTDGKVICRAIDKAESDPGRFKMGSTDASTNRKAICRPIRLINGGLGGANMGLTDAFTNIKAVCRVIFVKSARQMPRQMGKLSVESSVELHSTLEERKWARQMPR